jgi:hypothetical protein
MLLAIVRNVVKRQELRIGLATRHTDRDIGSCIMTQGLHFALELRPAHTNRHRVLTQELRIVEEGRAGILVPQEGSKESVILVCRATPFIEFLTRITAKT